MRGALAPAARYSGGRSRPRRSISTGTRGTLARHAAQTKSTVSRKPISWERVADPPARLSTCDAHYDRFPRARAEGRGLDDGCTMNVLPETSRVQLDDACGRAPMSQQRPTKRASGGAVPPQHVLAVGREEALCEMARLARGESVELVLRRNARESLRRVPPAEQSTRDDRQLVSIGEQTQHEVVVLGPAAVAVADAAQHLGPDHQRGVRDRALDEGFPPDVVGAADPIEPPLVAAPAVRHVVSRKDADVASDRGQ